MINFTLPCEKPKRGNSNNNNFIRFFFISFGELVLTNIAYILIDEDRATSLIL